MLYLMMVLVLTLFEWLIWLIWLMIMEIYICCVCVCICYHFVHINSKWTDIYFFLLWLYWSIDQLRNNIHCCHPCFRNHVLVQFKLLTLHSFWLCTKITLCSISVYPNWRNAKMGSRFCGCGVYLIFEQVYLQHGI